MNTYIAAKLYDDGYRWIFVTENDTMVGELLTDEALELFKLKTPRKILHQPKEGTIPREEVGAAVKKVVDKLPESICTECCREGPSKGFVHAPGCTYCARIGQEVINYYEKCNAHGDPPSRMGGRAAWECYNLVDMLLHAAQKKHHAPVTQGTEIPFPKRGVEGSNPSRSAY